MVVGRFSKELILPAIKTAIFLRFGEIVHLKRELAQLRRRGSERKPVEKARGLLIVQSLSEEAFSSLRNTAMNSRLKLVEVAKRLVEHGEIAR